MPLSLSPSLSPCLSLPLYVCLFGSVSPSLFQMRTAIRLEVRQVATKNLDYVAAADGLEV